MTRQVHKALMALAGRPYGDPAQSHFNYRLSVYLWSQSPPQAVALAEAEVREQFGRGFVPRYDPRLTG